MTRPTVSFHLIGFRWRRGRNVFADFTHTFDEFPVGLLGPNGAGKSTLLTMTAGILEPSRGYVRVESNGLAAGKQRELRRAVGLVSQTGSGIPGLSVRESVAYAGWLKGMSRTAAWWASETATDRVNLGEVSGVPSARLSGGEAKRCAIAQALVSDPRVLLLDEATTGLDPSERHNLVGLISELSAEKPVIGATHEVDDLQESYRVIAILLAGRIVYQGATAEFLAQGGPSTSARQRAESAYRRVLESA